MSLAFLAQIGNRLPQIMLAKVCAAAINGIAAYPVEVEVNAGYGDTFVVIFGNVSPNPRTR